MNKNLRKNQKHDLLAFASSLPKSINWDAAKTNI